MGSALCKHRRSQRQGRLESRVKQREKRDFGERDKKLFAKIAAVCVSCVCEWCECEVLAVRGNERYIYVQQLYSAIYTVLELRAEGSSHHDICKSLLDWVGAPLLVPASSQDSISFRR